jgi:hypothetical protein
MERRVSAWRGESAHREESEHIERRVSAARAFRGESAPREESRCGRHGLGTPIQACLRDRDGAAATVGAACRGHGRPTVRPEHRGESEHIERRVGAAATV